MEASLPVPAPTVYPETEPFWQGTAQGRLVLPRCEDCGVTIWYPRSFCPKCGSRNVAWFEATGHGQIYSFTECYRGSGEYRKLASYILALVELDEGPRLMTNLVDVDPDNIAVGKPVEVVFHDTGEGSSLVRFRLADEHAPNPIGVQ